MGHILNIIFRLILCIDLIYSIIKSRIYRYDERGEAIMNKALKTVSFVTLLMFLSFSLYESAVEIFKLNVPTFSLFQIEDGIIAVMFIIYTVNTIAIMYYEKTM